MDTKNAIKFLNFLTANDILGFGLPDLRLWTRRAESDDSLRKSIKRHCETGLFLHVCKDFYVNGLNNPFIRDPYAVYRLANVLRPRANNWESLESRLSHLGVISQIPNRLTFMTTGKAGIERTALGIFEFSHSPLKRLPDTVLLGTGILHATAAQAYEDLRFVGRNLGLVDMEELKDRIKEYENGGEVW